MKLVELLAKELSEWPEEATQASQDYDREIRFYDADEDQLSRLDFFVEDHSDDACDAITFAGGGVRVTKAQWQAERDRQKGGEWKRARGRKPKYETEIPQRMEVRHRDGDITKGWTSQSWNWSHSDGCPSADIMAWRVISQPQAEEPPMIADGDTREYKGPFPCSPIGEAVNSLEWDIEFPQGVFHMEAKTDQIDGPIKWRDTVNELDAYIEEFTREREALINRLAVEGFALIPAMTAVMGVADVPAVDMHDWLNWEVGDVVEVIANMGGHEFAIGDRVHVVGIDLNDSKYRIEAQLGDGDDWWLLESDAKWISRP